MKRPFNVSVSGRIFLLCFVLVLIFAVQEGFGREIAGVAVPETMSLNNKELVLNGAGIRKKFFVKVYVGALYLTAKRTTADQILSDGGPKRILMSFLYKEVSAEKLVDGWNDGFGSNNSPEELKALQDRIDQFNSLFATVHKGDVIRLDYIPDEGTRVLINDMLKGTVPGEDFSSALLKIWLGREPADGGLKDAMLGNTY